MYMRVFRKLWYEGVQVGIRVKDEKSSAYIDFDMYTWNQMIAEKAGSRFDAIYSFHGDTMQDNIIVCMQDNWPEIKDIEMKKVRNKLISPGEYKASKEGRLHKRMYCGLEVKNITRY